MSYVQQPAEVVKTPLDVVNERLAELEVAVEQLPFTGGDQQARAREGVQALKNHLAACQLH